MSTANIIVLMVAILAIALAAWVIFHKEKTRKLRDQFGPEYDRIVDQEKNPHRAEALLQERQERVEKYHIRKLTEEERDLFAGKWRAAQEHFVDSPREAVAQADVLVAEAMHTRGYPMSDFDRRAADLSVDHPMVVENYRIAHDIAQRDAQGSVSTEDLRKAMQYYRILFEYLLEVHVLQHQ
jgi:hypothetical protein